MTVEFMDSIYSASYKRMPWKLPCHASKKNERILEDAETPVATVRFFFYYN